MLEKKVKKETPMPMEKMVKEEKTDHQVKVKMEKMLMELEDLRNHLNLN